MITKKLLIIIIFINFLSLSLLSQNLFDNRHSLEFTDYLFKTKQYKFASIELERLIFEDKNNDTLKFMLLKSYRLSQDFTKGITRAETFYPTYDLFPELIAPEYFKLLISSNKINKTKLFLSDNKNIIPKDFVMFSIHLNILEYNWHEAENIFNKNINNFPEIIAYESIINKGVNFKRKSPFLAGVFSALLPGAGKVYTTWYKDAFFAFFSIAVGTWQSYKGFETDGITSALGWTFGTISTIFYISNIYGSIKSAKHYNYNYENGLIHKAEHILRY